MHPNLQFQLLKLAAPCGVGSSISLHNAVTSLRVNWLERECGPTYVTGTTEMQTWSLVFSM